MKFITREIEMTRYIFGRVNLESGKVEDMQTVTSAEPMTRKAKKEYADKHNVAFISETSFTERYSCPLDIFVTACLGYAESVKAMADTHEKIETEE